MMENGKLIKEKEKVKHIFIIAKGLFFLPNNKAYNGEWKNDAFNGKGTFQL